MLVLRGYRGRAGDAVAIISASALNGKSGLVLAVPGWSGAGGEQAEALVDGDEGGGPEHAVGEPQHHPAPA
jgi:hypothetical protein